LHSSELPLQGCLTVLFFFEVPSVASTDQILRLSLYEEHPFSVDQKEINLSTDVRSIEKKLHDIGYITINTIHSADICIGIAKQQGNFALPMLVRDQ
jgi:hypothetical protein